MVKVLPPSIHGRFLLELKTCTTAVCISQRRLLASRYGRSRQGSVRQTPVQCSSIDEPDWDAEMQLFKKRTMKPNQLETLRKMMEQVDLGKVLYCEEGLAIVEGLNNDAPIGSVISFVGGAQGVLLWRRSDNICFVLVLQDRAVVVGEAVECKLNAILQVVDEVEGPSTKREFETFRVFVGERLVGEVVDYICRPLHKKQPSPSPSPPPPPLAATATDVAIPLLNEQLDMKSREQICDPLPMQIMALDTLTPVGRGQAVLLTGAAGGGQTDSCIDAVVAQRGTGIRCVYAAVGKSREEVDKIVAILREQRALEYTTVVVAYEDAPLVEQYAALCCAVSIGEAVRDKSGDSMVALDTVTPMVSLWERMTVALADLGPKAMELAEGESAQFEDATQEELVEYEGMLVSAAAAQRRRFFSSLIQRSAKVCRRLGGGSLTLLMVLLGAPASGEVRKAKEMVANYQHLTEDQKQKLIAALETKEGKARPQETARGEVRTEVIEEWMSITDGQVVMRQQASGYVVVDPTQSCSRIGSRAYHPAMEQLAPKVRLELAQAMDARKFASDSGGQSVVLHGDPMEGVTEALRHMPRHLVPVEQQVVILYALQNGFLDNVPTLALRTVLADVLRSLRQHAPQILQQIADSKDLQPEVEAELRGQLEVLCTLAKVETRSNR